MTKPSQADIPDQKSLQSEITALKGKNKALEDKVEQLKEELAYFRRKLFGQSSERFIPDENQLAFFEDWMMDEIDGPVDKEKISYERKKPGKRKGGREEIPDHLPREITVLEPDRDTSNMERLGVKITEQLGVILV